MNDVRARGYGGPCPPIGRHRYFHKLYALDARARRSLREARRRPTLEKAMAGHVLATAELMGTYSR